MSEEATFRGYVKFDWLYFGRYDRLHAPVPTTTKE